METLVIIATVLFTLCYLPQLYTLWVKRKWEGYNPWFQFIECIGGILMTIGMVGLSKGFLLVLAYGICTTLASLCCIGWIRAKNYGISNNSKTRTEDKDAPV